MRILVVTEYFPPHAPGGAELSTARWCEMLSEAGHHVRIATVNFGAPGRETVFGSEVRRLPFPIKLSRGQRSCGHFATRNPFFYLYFGLFVARLARDIDVVHAQSENAVIPAWIASSLTRRPFFVTLRDLGLLCPVGTCLLGRDRVPDDCGLRCLLGPEARFFQRHYLRHRHRLSLLKLRIALVYEWIDVRIKQACARAASGIVSVSAGLAEIYLAAGCFDRQLVRVVHNPAPAKSESSPHARGSAPDAASHCGPDSEDAVDWAEYGISSLNERWIVLAAGKMSLGKGTYVLLEAARRLERDCPDVLFVLAGKGRVDKRPVPGNVRILGSVRHDALVKLYDVADVVVVPSIWPEPLSRVIIEAMSQAKPVIATRVGGSPELVTDGVTGVLVSPDDPDALATALRSVWADRRAAARMGRAAKAAVTVLLSESELLHRMVTVYEHGMEHASAVWRRNARSLTPGVRVGRVRGGR